LGDTYIFKKRVWSEIILNSNTCEAVYELQRASGLCPTETLRVRSTPPSRLVGRESGSQVAGRNSNSAWILRN